ncbi:MAG: hypothetical protein ACTSXL_03210 [Alphaproteobacteria bacterium]|nr:MAG: hypothetical protein B6I23_00830 [Rickettsiaceae bacterium 4572_127]
MKKAGFFFIGLVLLSIVYVVLILGGNAIINAKMLFQSIMAFTPLALIWTGFLLHKTTKTLQENKDKNTRLFSILTSKNSPESEQATLFIDNILEKEISKLTKINKDITENLELVSSRAETQSTNLMGLTQKTGKISELLSNRLNETMTALTEQLNSLKEASLILKESTIERETREIVMTAQKTVNEISQTNERMTETMENTSKKGFELVGTLTELTDKTDDTIEKFMKSANQVKENSHELIAESKGLDKLIIEENELLEEKVVKTREYAGQFKEIIDGQIANISNLSDNVHTRIRLSEASIEKQSVILSTTIENLLNQVGNVETQVGQASHSLLKISSQLDKELTGLGDSVAGHLTRVSEVAIDSMKKAEEQGEGITETLQKNMEVFRESLMAMDSARGNLIPFIELFEKKVSILPQVSEESHRRIMEVGRNLDKITSVMSQSYEKISQTAVKAENQIGRIDRLSDDSLRELITQTETLVKLSDTARESFGVLSSSLEDSMITISQKGSGVEETLKGLNKTINYQIEDLENKLEKTTGFMHSASSISDKQSVESFMKNAGTMLEKLNNLSIDLTRLFAPKVSDELWKRYQKGENDIFTRYLGKNLSPVHLSQLRRLASSNFEFQKQVEAFVNGFDSLLSSARKSAHKDLIISTFTQNPLGHIYMILKQIG